MAGFKAKTNVHRIIAKGRERERERRRKKRKRRRRGRREGREEVAVE